MSGLRRVLRSLGQSSQVRVLPQKRRTATRFERLETRWQLTGPTVLETDPGALALSVPLESDVAVVFDQAIAALSVTPDAIVANAQYSGRLQLAPADIAVNGDTATIKLPRRLLPGETVTVTVTPTVENAAGESAAPFQWEFRAQAIGGSADFEPTMVKWNLRSSSGLAVGDFDADGRIDVVAAANGEVLLNRVADGFESRYLGAPLQHPATKVVDFDADGDLDIAMFYGEDRQLWLNNGDATFVAGSTASWLNSDFLHEFHDLNNDGILDALFYRQNYGVIVALGDGQGNFTEFAKFGTTLQSSGVTVADLDEDGDLDLVGNFLQGSQLEIWLNDGTGRFAYDRDLTPLRDFALAADVDADGDADLLGSYFLLRNLGDGEFAEPVSIVHFNGAGGRVTGVQDFDGDGNIDALFNEYGETRILLNDGDGNFRESGQSIDGNDSPLIAGDMDGDGDLDLLKHNAILINKSNIVGLQAEISGPTAAGTGQQVTYVLEVENQGDQALVGARVDFTPPPQLRDVVWSAVASAGSSTAASGTGSIRIPVQLAPGGVLTYTITGVLDAFAGSSVVFKATATPPNGALPGFDSANLLASAQWTTSIFSTPTGGSGYFQQSGVRLRDELSSGANGDLQFGDLDGDGDEDAVLAPGGGVGEIWFNDGTGQFTRGAQQLNANSAGKVFLLDVHGDGDLDIYTSQYLGIHPVTRLWVNDGRGLFNRNGISIPFIPDEMADINADGQFDALRLDTTTYTYGWALGVRPTQFISSGQTFAFTVNLAGDLDGDGDLDMMVARESQYQNEDGTFIWRNNGTGYFVPDETQVRVSSFTGYQSGDVDGDGDLDLLFASARCFSCNPSVATYQDQLWLNDGDGNFSLSERTFPAQRSANFSLVDLDGDQDLDLVRRRDTQDFRNEVWWNDGTGGFTSTGQLDAEFVGVARRFADVDSDGDLDAILIGANQIWLNQTAYARPRVNNVSDVSSVSVGDVITYMVTVTNEGNLASTNLSVIQTLPDWLTDVTWSAVTSGGATAAPSGAGSISDHVDVPPGGMVTYLVTATVGLPQVSPFPDFVNASVRLTPDASIFQPSTLDLEAGEADVLNRPYSDGGYLAHVGTDRVNAQFNVAALGDLDGDGDMDLVSGSDGVRIWINDGTGNYGEPRDRYFGSTYIDALSLVDVDGDADLDIVLTRRDTVHGNAALLENDGQGHFTGRYRDVGPAHDIAAGDFDGDGDIDLVYARAGREIELHTQEAPWEFQNRGNPLGYLDADRLTPGDWDADGDLDLIVTQDGVPFVLDNDGTGRFSEIGRIGTDAATADVLAGDFNDDGHLDLFLAKFGGDEVWLNDGTGGFVKTGQSLGDAQNISAAIADLDGDGDLDVFASSEAWFNNGLGEFTAGNFPPPKPGAVEPAIGDIDGDGDADVVVGPDIWRNYAAGNDLEVVVTNNVNHLVFGEETTYVVTVWNHGNQLVEGVAVTSLPFPLLADAAWTSQGTPGTISSPSGTGAIMDELTLPAGGSVTYTLKGRVADVIGQQFVVVIKAELPSGLNYFDPPDNNRGVDSDPLVTSEISGGPGRFVDSGERLGADASNVLAADFDGDGDIDLFEGSLTGAGRIWLNDGAGRMTDSGQSLGNGKVLDGVVVDVDGDLDLDLFLVIEQAPDQIWFNDANGLFALGEQTIGDASFNGVAAAAGDLNQDGAVDLVLAAAGDQLSRIWWGDADGHFSSNSEIRNSSGRADVVVLDFENDGDLDLLFSRPNATGLRLHTNDGTGQFNSTLSWGNVKPATTVAAGDVDGDDWIDFVAGGPDGVVLLRNYPDGARIAQFVQIANVQTVALGDVNGDGRLDLVVGRGMENGAVESLVYLQSASGYFENNKPQRLGAGHTNSLALADFDGDGDLDIILGNNEDSGGVATWLWFNSVQIGDTAPFDGRIDLNDLNNVRNYFGATGPGALAGDADGDGDVDLADLNAVRNFFGTIGSEPLATRASEPFANTRISLREREKSRETAMETWSSDFEWQVWQQLFDEIGKSRNPRRRFLADPASPGKRSES